VATDPWRHFATANCRIAKVLFDPLVGDRQHTRRHFDAERLCGLEVEHKVKFGRLHHRQIGGLDALEDLPGIDTDLMIRVREVGAVAHQPAGFDQMTVVIGCWNLVARRKRGKLCGAVVEEPVGSDEYGIGALARERCKGRINLVDRTGFEDRLDLQRWRLQSRAKRQREARC
jgi:hypothetical protein